MKRYRNQLGRVFLFLVIANLFPFAAISQTDESRFVTYTVDCKKQSLKFYWKNDRGEKFKSIESLKSWLEGNNATPVFAMNAGMYKEDNSPLGLFIENYKMLSRLNSSAGSGNFYLQPNGIFYITAGNIPFVCETSTFKYSNQIKYATQSGPMLVINGKIHSAFKEGSTNLNVRNGVGILQDNKVIFVMSKEGINLFDFASYFQKLGCRNALYLDGFVSRTYLPEKNWKQTDGNFGVIIGVTVKGDVGS